MAGLSSEAKVGFFVVIGIVILAYMSMKVGKFNFTMDQGYDVYAYFDSVSGLAEDVQVEIAGVEAGRVRSISLENGKALVILRMNPEVKITRDVQAVIKTRGVLGDKYIELIQGSSTAPFLKKGEKIVYSAPATDLDALMSAFGEVAKDLGRLTKSVANVLGGEKGEASLNAIVENMKQMAETLNKTVQENNKDVANIIANFSDFSQVLKDIGRANKDDLRNIVQNTRGASEKIEELIASINAITTKINDGKGSVGKLINEDETIENLNASLASFKEITDKINKGEGSIGKLINEDETVENLNASLEKINDYMQKQETFRTYLDYRGEYLFDNESVKSYLSLRIQPKEDKYYLLQVIDDPKGKESITDISVVKDGKTTNERIIETEMDGIKFSAQIAKRYYDFCLRGGLFESTGGIGLDYYLFDDSLILSMEAFDFDPDRNAHLKFKADFTPFQHVYISSGFDDFISDEGKESFFIGAGISFSDEDIKTLMKSIPIPNN